MAREGLAMTAANNHVAFSYISKGESWLRAAFWCPTAGLVVTAFVCWFMTFTFGVSWPSQLIVGGLFAAITIGLFAAGAFTVKWPNVGVEFLFGSTTSRIFEPGFHWAFPGIHHSDEIPGPDVPLEPTMPEMTPEAKDLVEVRLGFEKKSTLIAYIVDPVTYARCRDPQEVLEGAFGNQVRLFINQMNSAINIVHERKVFEDFIEKTHNMSDVERAAFEERLKSLTYLCDPDDTGTKEVKRVFEDSAVDAIMSITGLVHEEALHLCGLRIENLFAPSVQLPEDISGPARQKVAQGVMNDILKSKTAALRRAAEDMQGLGLTADSAFDRAERNRGEPSAPTRSVQDTTFSLGGKLEEATASAVASMPAVVGAAASAARRFSSKRRSSRRKE